MVKEVINALDPTKASNPDCIPVVFLKSELYIKKLQEISFSRFLEGFISGPYVAECCVEVGD